MLRLIILLCSLLAVIAAASRSLPPTSQQHLESVRARRRKNLKAASATVSSSGSSSSGTLDVNCLANGNLTGYQCRNYMTNSLKALRYKNYSYDPIILPVVEEDTVMEVEVLVTFIDLTDVNVVDGTMTTSVFIDFFWTDAIIGGWDPSVCNGVDELVVPNDLLWLPDIQIYNSIGGYHKDLDTAATFLYSDGSVWWSGRGVMTFACTYELTRFPFDSQECTMEVASWIYSTTHLNITTVTTDVWSSFENLAWDITSVRGRRADVVQWETYNFSFALYTVYITRYYSHYLTTAILPTLIITSIVLCGLFVPDLSSRLSLSVTGLLTIIAVQWSVSSYIPVASGSNWLSDFLVACMGFVGAVCAECYIVSLMRSRKESHQVAPRWVGGLVRCSHWLNWRQWRCVGGRGAVRRGSAGEGGCGAEADVAAVELKDRAAGNSSSDGESAIDASVSGADSAEVITWEKGSRALDRICRVVIPLLFAIVMSVFLAEEL